MNPKEFDFGGFATKNDILCADGRKIKKNAFKNQHGTKVPLVWQHERDTPENVLGYAILENRPDGVYAYGKFNASKRAQQAKMLVEHGDITSLSIYANQLVQKGGDVTHGLIREVSLVIAPANPGAVIDNPVVQHGDEEYFDETRAIITCGEEPNLDDVYFEHGDDEEPEETKESVKMKEEGTEKEETEMEMQHADEKKEEKADGEETVQDVYNTFTEKQKKVVAYIVGAALSEGEEDDEDDAEHSGMKGDYEMHNNIFDQNKEYSTAPVLTHDEFTAIVDVAKKNGSLKEAFIEHAAATYGIENIDILFPDAKAVNSEPYLIKRDTEWVAGVLSETRHVPFSRIKSTAADLTADEARAKGYVKGNLKKEEVIRLLKRVTTPTTVYKKQKLDRDDIVDITDINVVAFLKAEMRVMLNEELARAFLVGDGREADDEDKIDESCIRPIAKDDGMYAHKVMITGTDPQDIVKSVIRSRKFYKGSGAPTLYTTADMLVEMLLAEDKIGRRLYNSEAELAAALRVSKIVEVPVMEDVTVETDDGDNELLGIIVNLRDYTVGATKGGEVSLFDDFDIDYNQYKYLIETRCAGTLVMPKSALVLLRPAVDDDEGGTPGTPPEGPSEEQG